MEYTVAMKELGMVIYGNIPLSDLRFIEQLGHSKGFKQIDAAICGALRASLVLTNKSKSKRWRSEIQSRQDTVMRNPHSSLSDRIALYLGDGAEQYIDAGLSSKTLLRILSGRLHSVHPVDIPRDADDFGRCVRMLELFPEYSEWRADLESFPKVWKALGSVWGHLGDLYKTKQYAALEAELVKFERSSTE